MNAQEKAAFFRKRRETLEQLDAEIGMTIETRKKLAEAGVNDKKDFENLPMCMRNSILHPPKSAKDDVSTEASQDDIYTQQKEQDEFHKFLGKAAPNKFFDEQAKKIEAQLNALQREY
jgi:hypothetical protein